MVSQNKTLIGKGSNKNIYTHYKFVPVHNYAYSPSDQASKRARSPADTSADSADIISKKKRKALARKEKSDPNRSKRVELAINPWKTVMLGYTYNNIL